MFILKDILAKKSADLSDEEKAFLQEKWAELSDEQKKEFDEVAPSEETTTEETTEEVDEKALKDLIVKSITEKVEATEITEKISAAATEVAKSLGEQRKKAINVIKTTSEQDQANVKSFFRAVLSNDQTALKAMNTGTNSAGGYTIPKELSLEIIRNATLEYGAARRLFNNYVFNGPGNTVDIRSWLLIL